MLRPLRRASTAAFWVPLCALQGLAQSPEQPAPLRGGNTSLSAECRVPVSELYSLAPLPRVKLVSQERRPLTVLALGPASGSRSSQSGGLAPFPVRLERELERALPRIKV